MLQGKKIILGITGSIAAYKTAMLTRLLVKAGAEVQIIMTDDATEFITPLTLSTLSQKPVLSKFVKSESGEWNNHVELGLWADLLLIAPASANTIAKCANGICDNLLLATYLSAKCPIAFAPAMDLDMYKHPSTSENLRKLESFGNIVIQAASGELASGLEGQGRMQEPEYLVKKIEKILDVKKKFKGKKVIITAGPTQEAIDPVRFIGNHSSGKMGYAIAKSFLNAGAHVTLISGPSSLHPPSALSTYSKIQTAQEMYAEVDKHYDTADIIIFAAAVADYRPKSVAKEKIKKQSEAMTIEMEKTIDIAKTLGARKKKNQLNIGFALETENEEENALNKLKNKNFDLIVLNSMRDKNATFGHNTNKIKIFSAKGLVAETELLDKSEVAEIIVNQIHKLSIENE
ncbi:bifunctional phosphopantothenoylcysteine decarboxylase/phosphopantothenate--cysteine ligase CoaBC [Marivirga harenae]|uniref:bifunctional phosphopantothenoylcysteine decarboxylase/phosphopantothenate--cysteine ligase CoaBC n=1 Tax=Marivirga harenae TaxID=2010992 RepID=UPI0026E065FD|nr:bifunctional phosphopantothenoylcysteine decarboxylase/phosphopantothenate--cysteine ligase CoaBC [Marivirga harenae]WKV11850.1 bifunctional phosphopantothenoylcysteine decarboxylase/phosphopantothenate--cysteine ligase CoaBC [Marivirga harenae]